MSFRAYGRLFIEAVIKLGLTNSYWRSVFLRNNIKAALKRVTWKQSQRLVGRVFQNAVRSPNLFRPFSTTLHSRQHFSNIEANNSGGRFQGWIRVQKRPQFAFLDHIRNIFSTNQRYNASLTLDIYPQGLHNYEIGKFIAVGCNAAVYELRTREYAQTSSDFPLALKIMFNYDFSLPERTILRDMVSELVPLANMPSNLLIYGRMGTFQPLERTHPNIIKLHTAFIGRFPETQFIEKAQALFPEALPSADVFGTIINEPKTLFIVMKRYRMTLREYVLTHKRNYWTGRVMFGQLMEALVFLYEQSVSHRDLKSDNILLDFDDERDIPHLVVSDFGSAQTASFYLNYDDFSDLGGNLSLRAPEIRRAEHGALLDFSLSDTWAAATLAYEIFTRMNPFYSKLSSATYSEDDLPNLPERLPFPVKSVVYRMLKIEPEERVLPHVAANVISLSLFRFGNELPTILRNSGIALELYASKLQFSGNKILDKIGAHLNRRMDEIIGLFASETIISNLITPNIISRSELQLRATFLSRLDRSHLWNSLEFFVVDNNPHDNSSTISSGSNGYPTY